MVVVGDDVVVGGCGGEAVLGDWVGAAVVVDSCSGEAVGGDEVSPPSEDLNAERFIAEIPLMSQSHLTSGLLEIAMGS